MKAFLDLHKDVRGTTDYKDILKSDVDLVAIATPPETHYQIATDCLEANKHVLVEKPLTLSSKSSEELIELSERKNLKLFVDHTFVFHPVVRKIREIITKGELGNVLYFDSERVNLGLLQSTTNVVWDLAVHDFSILMYLFDNPEIKNIKVFASKHTHHRKEDIAHIVLELNNNIVAHIHVSWLSPVKIRKIIIGGNEKMLWWDDVHPFEKLRVYESKIEIKNSPETPFFPIYTKGDVKILKVANKESLQEEVNSIVESILSDKPPEVGGYDGLGVVKMLELCDAKIKEAM